MPAFAQCYNCGYNIDIRYDGVQIPHSPVPHLLHTNRVPTELESEQIKNTIAHITHDLSYLEADID